jgi:hypothetical protein
MLVASMSYKEIAKELIHDTDILNNSSTLLRLACEYDRERTKKKIKREDDYIKYYRIKSKAKNIWILRLQKDEIVEKYHPGDISFFNFTFYHSPRGLRVLYCADNYEVDIFTGHLFHRYRERMKLNIQDLLDIATCFFSHNHAVKYEYLPEKDGIKKFYGVIKDGYVMGDYMVEDNIYLFKTFISKATSNPEKNAYEAEYMAELKEKLSILDKVKDLEEYEELLFMYKCLVQPEEDEFRPGEKMVKGIGLT